MKGGLKINSNKIVALHALLFVVALAAGGMIAAGAQASHIDWDARRAEREVAREARRLEREQERIAASQPQCTCSTSLSYAKPSLQFSSGGLTFIPRVNVDIRLRGDTDGPRHTVSVRYQGGTSYASRDVALPPNTTFSGEKMILEDVACEGSWSFKGLELERVPLPGVTASLVGDNERLDGKVGLATEVLGCEPEEENREFSWRMLEFGNLRPGLWRSVR